MASILRLASSATLAADAALASPPGDLHDLGEVAAHVDEARRVGDVGVAEIEVGFVAVGGKRAGPARKKLLGNALPAGLVYSNTYTGTLQRAEQNSHILDFFFASRFGSFRT